MIALREARWIGRDRAVAHSRLLLLFYLPGLVACYLIAIGQFQFGSASGTDFLSFWAAARLVLDGSAAETYRLASHAAVQQAVVPGAGYFAFFYPPAFLIVVAPFGLLPYGGALIVWVAGTFLAYLTVARRLISIPDAIWPIALFPAVYVNATHGQNGFITAALLIGGLLALRKAPLRAGMLLGFLVIKPHFGLLLPVALAAGGHWRAFVGAALSGIGLSALPLILFGSDIYTGFLSTLPASSAIVSEGTVGWAKMQSAYAAVRLAGGAHLAAALVQTAVALFAAVAVWRTWRSTCGDSIKYTVLLLAIGLATPFLLDYDLVLLVAPLCWLAAAGIKDGFLPWERLLMAGLWWLPLFSRPLALKTGVSLMPFLLLLLLSSTLRRSSRT